MNPAKKLKCERCWRSYATKSALERHNKNHPYCVEEDLTKKKFRRWTCERCRKSYASKEGLTKHNERFPDCEKIEVSIRINKRFTCRKCWKSYGQKVQLDQHNKNHPNCVEEELNNRKTKKWRTCERCLRLFGTASGIRKHNKLHPNCVQEELAKKKKTIKCERCGKIFLESTALVRHNEDHPHCLEDLLIMGYRKCKRCEKRFSSVQGLLDHHKKHPKCDEYDLAQFSSNRERLICAECGDTFPNKAFITLHYEKEHPKSSQWIKGSIINPQEGMDLAMTYDCAECNRTYKRKAALVFHLKKKHPEVTILEKVDATEKGMDSAITYDCSECERTYKLKNSLMRHLKEKHPEVNPAHEIVAANEKIAIKEERIEDDITISHNCSNGEKTMTMEAQIPSRRSVICPICSKTLRATSDLKIHIETVHQDKLPYHGGGLSITFQGPNAEKGSCPFCMMVTRNKYMLRHFRDYHKDKLPFLYKEWIVKEVGVERRFQKCPLCEITVKGNHTLTWHFQMFHVDELPYHVDENFIIQKPLEYLPKEITDVVESNRQKTKRKWMEVIEVIDDSVLYQCSRCDYANVKYLPYMMHLEMDHCDLLQMEIDALERNCI